MITSLKNVAQIKRQADMKTISEIKAEIKAQEAEIDILVVRRDQYLKQNNEFAYGLMEDSLGKVFSKIESLKWVLGENEPI